MTNESQPSNEGNPRTFMRLRAPSVILEAEQVWAQTVIWHGVEKRYLVDTIARGDVEAVALFSKPPLSKNTAELVDWLSSGSSEFVLHEAFGFPVHFVFSFGQPWSLRDEDPPIWLEREKTDAELSVLIGCARALDLASFGWQKKERFCSAIISRARALGIARPVNDLASMSSLRHVIDAGRARDAGDSTA